MIQPFAWFAVTLSQVGIPRTGPRPLAVLRLRVTGA
jgi:hypothetical protein